MSSVQLPPDAIQPPPYVVIFGPSANCTLEICPVQISVYGYRPSLAANISFIALYVVAATIHTYLGFRWKSWWFAGCMIIGAVNAIIGYIGRVLMYYNPFNFAAFVLQIVCITTGPVYYCAAIYITLALSINYLAPDLSRFKPKLFYYIFIPCDLFSLVVQAVGGGLSTSTAGQSQTGVNLALVGLAFQVFTILLFCVFFGDYLIRYWRSGRWQDGARSRGGEPVMRLRLFFGFMVAAVLLTLARCAYRLAELNQGYRGELIRDEVLFIVFEGVMVLSAVYCLMIGHPGFVFKPEQKYRTAVQDQASGHSGQELRAYPHQGVSSQYWGR